MSICSWTYGLAFSIVGGAIGAGVIVWFLRWLVFVPKSSRSDSSSPSRIRLWAFTNLIGALERFIISLLVLSSMTAAFAFSATWIGLKMATNWNRQGRIEAFNFTDDVSVEEKWRRVAGGSLSALMGSVISAGFGIVGGLIIKEEKDIAIISSWLC